jgi:hypothetical protein
MAWGRLLFVPIFIVLIPGVALHLVFRLPMLCCHRLRAVRWLSLAGLCYYSVAVTLVAVLVGRDFAALLLVSAVTAGDWLLPNPWSFVFHPAWRRAARRAVEYVEQQGGPRPLYSRAVVVASRGRLLVALDVDDGLPWFRPPAERRWLAVGADGAVEELDFGRMRRGLTAPG